MLKNNYFT